MIETIFQIIALTAYLFCGIRIICFNRIGEHNSMYAAMASILIGSFIGQSIHILFYKDPITMWDAIFAVLLATIIFKAKGNVAKLIWSTQ